MKSEDGDVDDLKRVLITVDEAARRLSIGRSHVYEQMRLGVLRSIRIGRSRRILESDLVRFVDELVLQGGTHNLNVAPRLPVKRLPSRAGRR